MEAIRSRLLSASRENTYVDVEARRTPATVVRDPESDCWLVHTDRGDHAIVLTGEHADPMAVSLTAVSSVEPFLRGPLRR